MFAAGTLLARSLSVQGSTTPDFDVTLELASDLQQAIDNVKQHPLPCSPAMQSLGVEGSGGISTHAYAVQHKLRQVREGRGEKVVGFKVGCTSAAIRTQLGLKESVHGYLWESEQYSAGCVLSSKEFYGIAIEGELAVRILSMPLASTSASATAVASPEEWEVEYFPTIELHHGKLDGNRHAKAAEIVARNCIHAGVVHCGKVKKCKLKDIPLNTPINVRIGGKLIEAPVLKELALEGKEGPVGSVTFLIRRLAESRLEHPDAAVPTLKEGMLVMTATPGRLLPVNVEIGTASVDVDVEFGGQQVSCTITP